MFYQNYYKCIINTRIYLGKKENFPEQVIYENIS